MPTPSPARLQARRDFERARAQAERVEREAQTLLAERADARAALRRALASGDDAAIAGVQGAIADLETRLEERRAEVELLRRSADEARASALDGEAGFDLLDPAMPLLLLPVRVETRLAWLTGGRWRFTAAQGGAPHLLVRLHPDEVHADGHDPQLTPAEAEWSRQLSAQVRPGTDFADALTPWSQLVANAGAARAAWLVAAEQAPPVPLLRPGAWSRPVTAALLPDRWVVEVTCRDTDEGVVARSERVREPLHLTPDPRGSEPAAGAPATVPGGSGTEWITDFDVAQRHGMAVAVPLPAACAEVRRVVVVGVRGSLDPAMARDELERVLSGHRYTRGVGLPAPGAPTTSVAPRRAAFSTTQASRESLRREFAVLSDDGDGSNGARLAQALGIGARTFAHVERADERDAENERALRALVAAALRRPLGALLDPAVPDAWLDEMLPIFVADVCALGPLPALRIGSQPYGVLPISLLFDRTGAAGDEDRPLAFAETLRSTWWDAAVDAVPRLRRGLTDPGRTFVDALQAEGTMRQVRLRAMLGADTADAVLVAAVQRLVRGQLQALAKAQLDTLVGHDSGMPPLLEFVLAPGAAALTAPLVSGDAGSDDDPASYLPRLLTRSLDDIAAPGDQPTPLLYHLCRAALLEAADAGAIALAIQGGGASVDDIPPWTRDISIGNDENFWTPVERLGSSLPGQTRTIGRLLHEDLANPHGDGVRAVRQSITALTFIETERLEHLTRAVLGLTWHRLDAWYTAMASRRLRALRTTPHPASGSDRRHGVNVGAYAILDDFLPRLPLADTDDADVYTQRGNGGWIHAPSRAHAATAAVLRCAHLTRAAAGSAAARTLAIDLSSRRVRTAMHLLDGLRQGQPLPALLGYRVERGLAARRLQRLIAPLRSLAPLRAATLTAGADPADAVAATNVIDGIVLLSLTGHPDRDPDPARLPWGSAPLPSSPAPAELSAFGAVLVDAAGAADALGDLILAEAVHQIVEGNPARSHAASEFLAAGPVGVPEPEIARTPRTGIATTARLLALLPSAVDDPVGWALTPRAAAEPRIAAWAAQVVPPPSRIRLRGSFPDAGGGLVDASLADLMSAVPATSGLRFAAADLLVAPDLSPTAQESALELRLATLLDAARPAGVAAGATVVLDLDRDPSWDPDDFSVLEAVEIARALRDLLAAGRPLEAADLTWPPGGATAFAPLVGELRTRADDAAADFGDLDLVLAHTDVDVLRTALWWADAFGIPGAALPPGAPVEELTSHADYVRAEVKRRRAAVDATEASIAALPPDSDAPDAHVQAQLERLRAVFGPAFQAVPLLGEADAAAASTVRDAFDADRTPIENPARARAWLARTARVRSRAAALRDLDTYHVALAESVPDVPRPHLSVAQLPHAPDEPWTAERGDASPPLRGGRVSIVAYEPIGDPWTDTVAGVMLDEWSEVVPSADQVTSVAFHADAPTSAPPQTLLLAVPHPGMEEWSAEVVLELVDEAMRLAKLRAVSPTELGVSQFLPLLVGATDPELPTVGLDLSELTQPG